MGRGRKAHRSEPVASATVEPETVRVFVASSPNGEDAEAEMALEWSLKARSSLPVDVTFMRLSRDPASMWSGWRTERWATPFSAFRWAVPAACNFEGRAIYMDVDTVAVADIAELWRMPIDPGKIVVARGGGSWRFCVSLWDCAAAKDYMMPLDELKADPTSHVRMIDLFRRRPELVQAFPAGQFWNFLDTTDVDLSLAKVAHFTNMASQPHAPLALARGVEHWFEKSGGVRKPHPNKDMVALFTEAYDGALAAGYKVEDYLPAEPFGDFRKADLTGYLRGHAA